MNSDAAPTIADLEAESADAVSAHDKAVARREALFAIVCSLEALESATTSAALLESDRAAFRGTIANVSTPWLATLKAIRETGVEIDRLETACHEAAHALNSADEAA
jgi:hypothetical protein